VKACCFILSLPLFLLTGCGQYNLTPEVTVSFQDPVDVSETGFTLSWSINPSDYNSLSVFLATDPSFNSIVQIRTFQDNSLNTVRFDSLHGATTYYYRISIVRHPGSIFISSTCSIETPFASDAVSFSTPDSAVLKGSLCYLGSIKGKRPAILLMHEFGIFVNGWINSDLLKTLVAEGYICLIYYNRGHGSSSYFPDLTELIKDPRYLANDLRGALGFITAQSLVRPDSIALIGASMGASMAVAGNGNDSVRASVALSPGNIHINYMYPGVPLRTILYIVGENDVVNTTEGTTNYLEEARFLYDRTEDPRKLVVVKNTSAHGTHLMESSVVNSEILQWIRLYLPVEP
jgi:dienelactone hydrolase